MSATSHWVKEHARALELEIDEIARKLEREGERLSRDEEDAIRIRMAEIRGCCSMLNDLATWHLPKPRHLSLIVGGGDA